MNRERGILRMMRKRKMRRGKECILDKYQMEERGNPTKAGKVRGLGEVTPPEFDLLTVDTNNVYIEALKVLTPLTSASGGAFYSFVA